MGLKAVQPSVSERREWESFKPPGGVRQAGEHGVLMIQCISVLLFLRSSVTSACTTSAAIVPSRFLNR